MTLRSRRIVQWAIAGMALAIGVVAAIAAFGPGDSRPRFQAVDITGVPWGKELALTDHLGRKRSLADFRGKTVALYFASLHDGSPKWLVEVSLALCAAARASRAQWSPGSSHRS